MRNLTILLISSFFAFALNAQTTWQELPVNSNVNYSGVVAFDIASSGNYSYFIYAKIGSGNKYDIIVEGHTVATGWQTIETFSTNTNSSSTDIHIKAAQSGSRIYFMAETDNADKLTIYEIDGWDSEELTEHAFAGFTSTANWNFYPGTDNNEAYFMYNTKLERYSYSNDSWTGAGNVYSGSGITPLSSNVYVNDDSVYVASSFTTAGTTKIRIQAASKATWSWNNYTSGTNNLYYMNGSLVDTVTGSGTYFIYGNGQQIAALAKDNSVSTEIPLGTGLYGTGSSFPLEYDNNSDIDYNGQYAFMMTTASNLASPNVVYRKSFATGEWSQLSIPFDAGTINSDSKRIRVNNGSGKVMIAFRDGNDYTLALSGEEPVIISNGTASTLLCSNAETALLTDMVIEDPLGGTVTLVGITSDNEAVIDPDNIDLVITSPSAALSNVNASVIPGNVTVEETVTVTFTFTNGDEEAEAVITYTVVPNQMATFSVDELDICTNGDMIDLDDYISASGGIYTLDGEAYNGHYFDPLDFDMASPVMNITYSMTTGFCTSEDELTINLLEAPQAEITTTGTSNCDQNDGGATLSISGGVAPYNFTWNTGNNTDLALTQLNSGAVHADIIDDQGCFITADAIIYNTGISVTGTVTPTSCNGTNDGAIEISYSGLAEPVTVLWSGGYSSTSISNLPAGAHQVWASDASGCVVSELFIVPEPEELELEISSVSSTCGETDGSVTVSDLTGGTEPYSYEWSNNAATQSISNVESGIYTLTVTDANGCSVSAQTGVSDANAPFAELSGVTEATCNLNDGGIAVVFNEAGTDPVFTWSTGLMNNNLLIGVAPGFYSISGTNAEGCTSYSVYEVPATLPQRQDICVVTVDEETTTNLLVWEKNEADDIHHFNIYRESVVAGQFQLIDTVMAENISIFNDVVASPALRSWSYRISAVDECNTESVPSVIHKTIHLNTNEIGGGQYQVVWNNYQGLSAAGYNFFRFTNAGGWEQITTTSTGVNYFTDAPTDIDGLDYMVTLDLEPTCTADFNKSQDFNSSRSNKDRAQFMPGSGTGQSSNGIDEAYLNNVKVYPNPVSDVLIIAQETNEDLMVEILSVDGSVLENMSTNQLTREVNMKGLASGIYFVKLQSGSAERMVRVVKN